MDSYRTEPGVTFINDISATSCVCVPVLDVILRVLSDLLTVTRYDGTFD